MLVGKNFPTTQMHTMEKSTSEIYMCVCKIYLFICMYVVLFVYNALYLCVYVYSILNTGA